MRSLLGYTMVSALILLAGVVIGSDERTVAVTQLTANVDADAPGMIHVAWPVGEFDTAHRISWWTGSATRQNPTGSVVRAKDGPLRSEAAITLTGLAAGSYDILVESTTGRGTSLSWTEIGQAVTATVAAGPYTPVTPCPNTISERATTVKVVFCVDVTNPSALGATSLVLEWISNETGGGISSTNDSTSTGRYFAVARDEYPRPRTDRGLNPDNELGSQDWYRARIQIRDYAGLATSRWWTQPGFRDLDTGATFMNATDYLVRHEDEIVGTPPTFQITLDDEGVVLSGTITKDVDGVATALDARSFFDGGDIASPCVAVFTEVDGEWPWVQDVCAFGGTPDNPQSGGFSLLSPTLGAGDWRFRLPRGVYKIRIIDRMGFGLETGQLDMRVRFASQWYSDGDTIAENVDQATVIDTRTGDNRTGLDATLRDAKQLDVVVTDVPEGFRDSARVVVTDEFGNWFSGMAAFDADEASWTTEFTGLVEGRRYKVFLYFSGSEGYRWWLVGGGTLELADGVIPSGEELIEPWQPMPYAVAVVDQFGQPWGAGEACFSLTVPGESGEDAVVASSCTETVDGTEGVVVLQRVLAGSYRVVGWIQDPATGETIGNPIDLGTIEVAADQEAGPIQPYAAGIADVGELDAESSLSGPYDDSWTVVVPDPEASRPESDGSDESPAIETFNYIVTMHEATGLPVGDGEACLSIRDESDEEVATTKCAVTAEGIPGVVLLEGVPAGTWTVVALRVVSGSPVEAGLSFEMDTSEWTQFPTFPDYGTGIADVSRLADGASLFTGYSPSAAVVLPAP